MTYPLPSGWKYKLLCEIGDAYTGNTPPTKDKNNYGNEYLFVTPADIKENKYITDSERKLSSKGFSIARQFKKGDILYVSIGSTIGKIAIANKELTTNQQINILRVNKYNNNEFVYYQLIHSFKSFSYLISTQAVPILNKTAFENISILLPPLEEQKRIAEVLSLCDDIIENLTELIEKKEQYKKGVMQRVLSGKVRFKGFTDEWQTVRLGDILSYEQPNNYIVKNDEYNNKYECPVLTAGKTFILGYTNEKFGIYDKIPVIIFDDFTTETKYVNFPFKVKSSAIKILSSNKCNLKLIYELIKMIKFNAESHKRYWISEYQYLEIKIPTSIEEQKKIAGLLSVIDEEIENLK